MSKKRKTTAGNGENDNMQHPGEGSDNGILWQSGGRERKLYTKRPIIITAKTENQKELLRSINENDVTIVYGPAGSGKSLLAVVSGLKDFAQGKYEKMIFTRPCVEANGENLGFLPGDLNEKISPYMLPIMDFLSDYLQPSKIEALMKEGAFVTIPLAFQRGCTFRNAFVLLDEAQNTIPEQIRMFLTRMGENCKVVINGDPRQSDIRRKNGLVDAIERLQGVKNLGIVELTKEDIVRSPMVEEIEERYADMDNK